MSKRLFIDLAKCDQCESCTVECSYFYQPAITEHGILALRELAAFAHTCRRCEEPSCVSACRFDALERQADGVMKRYNMRCVSCKCCVHACPFGTIYPETVPFYVSTCDFCIGTSEETPACVSQCVKGAVQFGDIEASAEQGTYAVGEHLVVRAPKWDKKDV